MNLDDWKLVFITATSLIVLLILSPYIIELLPSLPEESFFSLAILGKDGTADQYYPNNVPFIIPEVANQWYIYVHNHRGKVQQIKIKVKIMDFDTSPPNITTCTPGPIQEITEFQRVLLENETMLIPFKWTITEAVQNGEMIDISQIQINEFTLKYDHSFKIDIKMRVIFELWVYNDVSNIYSFDWYDLGETHCVWNQIQFNIKI